jgi:DNA-directed RNA polymerase subunit H (RpoH/RPB5)
MTATATTEDHLFFGARQTCLEMIRDRHYRFPLSLLDATEAQFLRDKKHTTFFDFIGGGNGEIVDLNSRKTYIILSRTGKAAEIVSEMRRYDLQVGKLEEITGYHVILVCDADATFVDKFMGHPCVEVFDVRHIFVNPTKYKDQPKWKLMDKEEITEVLQRYESQSKQPSRVLLGSVCIDDPVNRYYGGRPPVKGFAGDVFEIRRDGLNIFYRKVISKHMNLERAKK